MLKIKKDESGTLCLTRNGRNCVCPFMPPTVAMNNITRQQQIMYSGCNDSCTHFNLRGDTLTISCGSALIVEKVEQETELKIIGK
jgi:hypothetical protein